MNTINEAKADSIALATAVAMPTKDVESSPMQIAAGPIVVYTKGDNEEDGKGLGIAMFVLLLTGFIFNFILPPVSFVCIVATIVLASILHCGCCCAKEYQLKPKVKRFATSILVSLGLMFVVSFVGVIAAFNAAFRYDSSTDNKDGAGTGILIAWLLSIVLNVMAIIFSGLFTWGRGFGAQQPVCAI